MHTSALIVSSEHSNSAAARVQKPALFNLEDKGAARKLVAYLDKEKMRLPLEDACVLFGFRAKESYAKQQQVRDLLESLRTAGKLIELYPDFYCRPAQAEGTLDDEEEAPPPKEKRKRDAQLGQEVHRQMEGLKSFILQQAADPEVIIQRRMIMGAAYILFDCDKNRATHLVQKLVKLEFLEVIPHVRARYRLGPAALLLPAQLPQLPAEGTEEPLPLAC